MTQRMLSTAFLGAALLAAVAPARAESVAQAEARSGIPDAPARFRLKRWVGGISLLHVGPVFPLHSDPPPELSVGAHVPVDVDARLSWLPPAVGPEQTLGIWIAPDLVIVIETASAQAITLLQVRKITTLCPWPKNCSWRLAQGANMGMTPILSLAGTED